MLTIYAEIRTDKGKSFNRRLRINNKLPGVVYGIKKTAILLILDHNTLFNAQKKTQFYKENIILSIKDNQYIVKVQDIQRHSFKLRLLHIDFMYI